MRLPELEINEENRIEIAKKLKVLSNSLHLKALLILESGPKNNDEIFKILKDGGLVKFPASSYKMLEKLVIVNIINKKYSKDKRTFIYSV
ncbi:hypothetical protein ACFLZN_00825 [Nanoarchaeota archaeon]